MNISNTNEVIFQFWEENYHIIEEYVPVTKCISEQFVLHLFIEKQPEYKHKPYNNLRSEFVKTTSRVQPNVRRIKSTSGYHYNAELSSITSGKCIKFSLFNSQGIITENGFNKSKFIRDIVATENTEHMIAITETFLTKMLKS